MLSKTIPWNDLASSGLSRGESPLNQGHLILVVCRGEYFLPEIQSRQIGFVNFLLSATTLHCIAYPATGSLYLNLTKFPCNL